MTERRPYPSDLSDAGEQTQQTLARKHLVAAREMQLGSGTERHPLRRLLVGRRADHLERACVRARVGAARRSRPWTPA
ncbi:hypothetical protein OG585_05395 [Streptomyces sp. NBC_01340]|uniref:hypothetical protein n=1 Tax=unclassified Streptomyces TaxID=2593676 RepID=UPI00225993AA|nr:MULTISPECIES: hypothetical protein [unclassified Streptomyces]MCX4452098.1 hypothetical protein [Streptomyces sp. NBC_01719]MCX4491458.1 hypothetical protein [Streptomyces sp. NBC_01728]MCX4593966.1 hypothetical protein [Streptomyces sp. NBC_01549]WSI36764.1 hypothetical protein OG585_05395 [Streptomyces sp. NBC_01340]